MIRRSPAENYFKYLVCHPDTYDTLFIRGTARDLGLDYIGDWYVQWLRERMRPPVPFYPEDEGHLRSQKFLIKEGLVQVFLPPPAMKSAYKILNKPRWRELVETLLISHAPLEAVAHGLQVRHGFQANAEVIRLYRHFFWDVDLLDTAEMRALLEMRFTGAFEKTDDPQRLAQMPSLARSRHGDPRLVAAKLPNSPLTSMLAQLQMGIMPRSMPTAEIVQTTLDIASARALESVAYGGPTGAQMGQGFMAIAEGMTRIKELVVNPEKGLREDLRKIGVATTPNVVPTLHQLSAGRHTVNVHPDTKVQILEAEGVEVEDDDNDFDDEVDPIHEHAE